MPFSTGQWVSEAPRAATLLWVGRHEIGLAGVGHHLRELEAPDPRTALDILEHEPVDVALAMLGDAVGSELFDLMRKHFAHIPRLLVTPMKGFALGDVRALLLANAVVTVDGLADIPWLLDRVNVVLNESGSASGFRGVGMDRHPALD